MKKSVNIFWMRRDLRLEDNAGLYHALKNQAYPTLCLFIFDTSILEKLPRNDLRVLFIHQQLQKIKLELQSLGSDLLVFHNTVDKAWDHILESYNVCQVFTNHDYEPLAIKRDLKISDKLSKLNIELKTFKDQVIFEPGEILTNDNKPYTVFTPFSKKWQQSLSSFYLKPYPNHKYFNNLAQFHETLSFPSLESLGFTSNNFKYPSEELPTHLLKEYHLNRNFPAKDSTSKMGLHLRFGTVSIRHLAQVAIKENQTWLSELIWREFFMHLLFYFPKTVKEDFKPQVLNKVIWRNNPQEFEKWVNGQTGFPLIDAGMRELNTTGFMHNRVRMLVASFLVKNLLIHWKYGERYFAEKLLDYDLSANIGNWQWCAGCGADAAPYFRIFNPDTQIEKFDPNYEYIKKWVPEYGTDQYCKPMVDLKITRNRFLDFFKPSF